MSGCMIRTDFQRPAAELITRFRGIPVANIDDCMGRIGAADGLIPIGKGQLLGCAFTVRVPQGDNLMFHKAMDLAKPGDVVVIDAGGFRDRAILGELMATYCKRRGLRGIVCDGAIRDRGALSQMEDFQVYARAVTPNGPYKNGPGEINVPVSIGGKVVHPGDIVVGDEDGVIFIPQQLAETLAAAAEGIETMEAGYMKQIVDDGVYLRPWVDEKLKALGCEII